MIDQSKNIINEAKPEGFDMEIKDIVKKACNKRKKKSLKKKRTSTVDIRQATNGIKVGGGMKELLTCPVCLEGYLPGARRPLFLTCHHSVCAACLPDLAKPNEFRLTDMVTCPQCRHLTRLPQGGLPSNFYLLSLLESHHQETKPQAKARLSVWCEDCECVALEDCAPHKISSLSSILDSQTSVYRCTKDKLSLELKNAADEYSNVASKMQVALDSLETATGILRRHIVTRLDNATLQEATVRSLLQQMIDMDTNLEVCDNSDSGEKESASSDIVDISPIASCSHSLSSDNSEMLSAEPHSLSPDLADFSEIFSRCDTPVSSLAASFRSNSLEEHDLCDSLEDRRSSLSDRSNREKLDNLPMSLGAQRSIVNGENVVMLEKNTFEFLSNREQEQRVYLLQDNVEKLQQMKRRLEVCSEETQELAESDSQPCSSGAVRKVTINKASKDELFAMLKQAVDVVFGCSE